MSVATEAGTTPTPRLSAPEGRFTGQVAVVIGAAKGIGRVTAERFAAEGANVVVGDLSADIEGAARDLDEAAGGGGRVVGLQMDVTKEEDCSAIAQTAFEQFGKIDAVAVVAGILNEPADVASLPTQEWNRVFAVNVTGPFLMAKAVTPFMKERGRGRIINIASFWGRIGQGYFSAYCSSKAAVIVLTQSLAAEMATYGVTVNSVAPGMTDTELHRQALVEEAEKRDLTFEEFRDQEYAQIPLRKAGEPVDIANAVLFLASEDAKYITGASLDVNGGVLFR